MSIFGKNRLGYTISAEDKSKPAIDSAKGGLQSLERSLAEVAKNTGATEKATAELSQSIKGLGDNAGREFSGFSQNADRHFGQVAEVIARVGIGVVALRSKATATLALAGRAFVGIGAAIASANIAEGFVETAEAAKRTEAQLKLVTGEGREFAAVQKSIYQSSQSLGQPLTQSIDLYTSLGRGLKQAGYDYTQILSLQKSVGLALKAGSVDSISAAQGIRQLSQAFGAGALRGDEFTSVLENFPRLAQAIADGLGVPIGKLRGLAEQGLLTTTKILDALVSQTKNLGAEAAKIPLTIAQAATKLTSSIGLYVADIDKAIGVTSKLAAAVDLVASAFTRADDDLDGSIKRIREATGEFETFKLEINAVGTALDSVGVGDSAFLDLVSNISVAMSDASDKFKLFRELMGTVTAPANMALRVLELSEGSPEERRRRGNQVPGASSAPRFASMDDDSVMRQAQNRLENYDKLIEAEKKLEQASSKRATSGSSDNRKLASEAAAIAADRKREEKEIRRLQQEAFNERLDEIHEEDQVWRDLKEKVKSGIEERTAVEEQQADERKRILQDHAEENQRLFQQPFLNAIDGIQGGFTDAFRNIFSGGVSTFAEFADTVKNIFINLAAEIASLLVFQAVLGGVSGSGGGGVAGTAASLLGAGGGGGGGTGILGSLSSGSSVSGLFGGPSLGGGFTGAINTFGGSLGFGPGTATAGSAFTGGTTSASASSLTSASLSSVIGSAGAGIGIGSLIAGYMGGNSLVGGIAGGIGGIGGGIAGSALAASAASAAAAAGGAAAGAAAGSVVPVIGTIIGAILGGLLGGAIKETPPRGAQISTVGGGVTSQIGKKGFDPGILTPISGGIAEAILRSGRALGIDKNALRAVEFWIGYSEDGGLNTSARTPGGQSDFGDDINALQTEVYEQENQKFLRRFKRRGDTFGVRALKESFQEKTLSSAVAVVDAYVELRKQIDKAAGDDAEGLRFGSRVLSRALRKSNVRKAAASADADIAFKKEFDQVAGEADPLKQELESLRIEFNKLRNHARKLGLDLEDLNKVEKDRTKEFIAQRLGITLGTSESRLTEELKLLHTGFLSLRRHAEKLGLTIKEVGELEKSRVKDILSTRLAGAIGSIQSLREQTGIEGIRGFLQQQKTSEFLSPKRRLSASLNEFRDLRTSAREGNLGAAQALPSAAQELLTIGRDTLASGPAFASLFKFVNSQLLKVQQSQEKTFRFPNIEGAIRDTAKEQVRAIKEQTALLSAEIVLLRRELRRKVA